MSAFGGYDVKRGKENLVIDKVKRFVLSLFSGYGLKSGVKFGG